MSGVNNIVMPGETLPNGWRVLQVGFIRKDRRYLVYLAEQNLNDRHEYATWRCLPNDPKATYWGHYFNDEVKAYLDYAGRVRG